MMAAEDLIPALQTAVAGFNTVVDGKQPILDARLPPAQTALEAARVSRDGALTARDTTRLSRDQAYRDLRSAQANLCDQDLTALVASKAITAVDVFIYDTSKDSDGGAWRKRCTRTSWFNEPLSTATRGARRDFPAVAVIVAEATKVTIYDGDDPALPMWMEFNFADPYTTVTFLGYTVNQTFPGPAQLNFSLSAANGQIAIGGKIISGNGNTQGLRLVNFLSDKLVYTGGHGRAFPFSVAQRHSHFLGVGTSVGVPVLVNGAVNDVAMTVLPDAPVDPATWLQVPTIALATDGGVSVIKHDSSVTSFSASPGAAGYEVYALDFDDQHSLNVCHAYDPSGRIATVYQIGKEEWTGQSDTRPLGGMGFAWGYGRAVPSITRDDPGSTGQNRIFSPILTAPDRVAFCAPSYGLGRLDIDRRHSGVFSSVNYVAPNWVSGWLPGDIRGAFLANTDPTDLVGGTDADRSVKNNPLTINGTITRAPVATGAELVGYGPFPTIADYLSQPYNPALDFGDGDFCVMGWFEWTSGGPNIQIPMARNELGKNLAPYFELQIIGGAISWVSNAGGNQVSFGALKSGRWQHVVYTRAGGVGSAYLNGRIVQSKTDANNYNHAGADELFIGRRAEDYPCASTRLALIRISATAPTADQIRRIYEDEKVLFQENAACTLYGASEAVTALAQDPDTGLLHVGTSAGRSVFKGLRRVANTTQPVTTAISAANGMVIEK